MTDNEDLWEESNRNWLRHGAHTLEEKAKANPDFAESIKNELPRTYYSWEWTPDDPAL